MDKIIGRKAEQKQILESFGLVKSELVAVYGLRRVGKTVLIKRCFNEEFDFWFTGIYKATRAQHLTQFHNVLQEKNPDKIKNLKDWFQAFEALKNYLLSLNKDKVVVFLDEIPWMDTARSDFKSALDHFWNSYGSAQEDLVLIVCGSATSWIINNLLLSKKGFHNRVTKRIRLLPFTLKECEDFLEYNDIVMTRSQIIESYMVFGGVPYYLNLMDSRLSLTQNINELCFREYGDLHEEYGILFRSLFNKPEKHMAILKALSEKKEGLTRTDLSKIKTIGGGSVLTKDLQELEECGFIRRFVNFSNGEKNALYQLTDPFSLFSIRFIGRKKRSSWNEYINSPGYNAWRGNSFEMVCINHIEQIKTILGISGIDTEVYAWRSKHSDPGTQIDLLIDRKDGVINLCEMKYTNEEYSINKEEYEKIRKRLAVFQKESETGKAIHITLISGSDYIQNKYSGIIQQVITGEELFI